MSARSIDDLVRHIAPPPSDHAEGLMAEIQNVIGKVQGEVGPELRDPIPDRKALREFKKLLKERIFEIEKHHNQSRKDGARLPVFVRFLPGHFDGIDGFRSGMHEYLTLALQRKEDPKIGMILTLDWASDLFSMYWKQICVAATHDHAEEHKLVRELFVLQFKIPFTRFFIHFPESTLDE